MFGATAICEHDVNGVDVALGRWLARILTNGDCSIADCGHGGEVGSCLNCLNNRYSSGILIAVWGDWINCSGGCVRFSVWLFSCCISSMVGD